MGKKNQYSFSKRQREIAKKKKAEEKRLRKLAKKQGVDPDEFIRQSEVDAFGVPIAPPEIIEQPDVDDDGPEEEEKPGDVD